MQSGLGIELCFLHCKQLRGLKPQTEAATPKRAHTASIFLWLSYYHPMTLRFTSGNPIHTLRIKGRHQHVKRWEKNAQDKAWPIGVGEGLARVLTQQSTQDLATKGRPQVGSDCLRQNCGEWGWESHAYSRSTLTSLSSHLWGPGFFHLCWVKSLLCLQSPEDSACRTQSSSSSRALRQKHPLRSSTVSATQNSSVCCGNYVCCLLMCTSVSEGTRNVTHSSL